MLFRLIPGLILHSIVLIGFIFMLNPSMASCYCQEFIFSLCPACFACFLDALCGFHLFLVRWSHIASFVLPFLYAIGLMLIFSAGKKTAEK